jgi:hypothetical protein
VTPVLPRTLDCKVGQAHKITKEARLAKPHKSVKGAKEARG